MKKLKDKPMNQLSTYETAKLAKEAGFDEPCMHGFKERGRRTPKKFERVKYNNTDLRLEEEDPETLYYEITCPQLTTLQDYALEKWGIWVEVTFYVSNKIWGYIIYDTNLSVDIAEDSEPFNSKDEALEQGIQVALKEKIKEGLWR